jgi:hypothetical protein
MVEPWRDLLETAAAAGQEAGAEEERRLVEEAEATARKGRKGKLTREATEQVRRTERRARTQALDLGLALCCAWYRDLAAIASGADDVVLNTDRLEQLREDAQDLGTSRRRVGSRHQAPPAAERLRGARARGALAAACGHPLGLRRLRAKSRRANVSKR